MTQVAELAQGLRATLDASSLGSWPYAVAVTDAGGGVAEVCRGRLGDTVDLRAETTMYAASIAKQVIGVLMAQWVVGGGADPDEVLARYIDGLPPWSRRVRLRHLIHHTSGLIDDSPDSVLRSNSDALSRLRTASPLRSEPGTTYRYSNLGYICLAEVLSVAAGRRVELLASDLFASLGMTTATLGDHARSVPPGQQLPPGTVGDGGLWLSAVDLRQWNDAMNSRVLGDSVHELAERPGTLDDGSPLDYAWGVRVLQHAGRRTISHGGSWPTWSAKAVRQPDTGVSVAILTTCEDAATVSTVSLDLVEMAAR